MKSFVFIQAGSGDNATQQWSYCGQAGWQCEAAGVVACQPLEPH